MKTYLLLLLTLVANTNSLIAASTLPFTPEPRPLGPSVFLPADLHYATSLIHRYNAQVENPNLIIPNREQLLLDGRKGLQGWLPSVPALDTFPEYVEYPFYRQEQDPGLFIMFLPPDEKTNIGIIIQERLKRFIHYTCLNDGFPVPRPGRVQASDYQNKQSSTLGALSAGILLAIACMLILQMLKQRR